MQDTSIFGWLIFHVIVVLALILDLKTGQGGKKGVRFAVIASGFWISTALAFSFFVYYLKGSEAAINYVTAYLIEKSLSVDNLFVFLVMFQTFKIPMDDRRVVLFWGIIGAIVLRAIFIFVGIALVEKFRWILYLFAFMLLWLAIKIMREHPSKEKKELPSIVQWLTKYVPITTEYTEGKLWVNKNGRHYATPLGMCFLAIAIADVAFAVDSIPAVMGITLDLFVVYTSNIFAILGLRALYFALDAFLESFYYLNQGLAIILAFIALKIILHGYVYITTWQSLAFVGSVLLISLILSLWHHYRHKVH